MFLSYIFGVRKESWLTVIAFKFHHYKILETVSNTN